MDPRRLAEQLLAQAKQQGIDLVGPNGLLNQLAKKRARDRAGSGDEVDPQIVRKRQGRLTGVDEIVLSLSAKALTTGEIPRTSTTPTSPRSPRTPSPGSPPRAVAEMIEWAGRPCVPGQLRRHRAEVLGCAAGAVTAVQSFGAYAVLATAYAPVSTGVATAGLAVAGCAAGVLV